MNPGEPAQCRALCDAMHPCAAGLNCRQLLTPDVNPRAIGICYAP